jgi:hypothetical protein
MNGVLSARRLAHEGYNHFQVYFLVLFSSFFFRLVLSLLLMSSFLCTLVSSIELLHDPPFVCLEKHPVEEHKSYRCPSEDIRGVSLCAGHAASEDAAVDDVLTLLVDVDPQCK